MEKQLRNELRKLLTGRTIRDEEGWLIAIPDGSYLIYHGITDRTGYGKIKLREDIIKVADSTEKAFQPVMDALQSMGVLVNMKTIPDALCALCRIFLTKTVVLCVVPDEDGKVLVQAYTGRTLTAGIYCRLAISKFQKKLNLEQSE